MLGNLLTKDMGARGVLLTLVALAAIVGLVLGGRLAVKKIPSRTKSPEQVRKEVFDFLRDKSRVKEFKVELPSDRDREVGRLTNEIAELRRQTSLMNSNLNRLTQEARAVRQELSVKPGRRARAARTAPSSGTNHTTATSDAVASTTNAATSAAAELAAKQKRYAALQKDAEALQANLGTKHTELNQKLKDLQRLRGDSGSEYARLGKELRQQIKHAGTWETLYKALGNELWVAEQWLSATNIATRRAGLDLADQARRDAANDAENGWLAARIVEGFLWPNLDVADAGGQTTANADQLLTSASQAFQAADETNNVIRNAELLIGRTSSPARADYARSQLAYVHERIGNYETALALLREIRTSNVLVHAERRIPGLERRVKSGR
jgi:prefoldin subunit 5